MTREKPAYQIPLSRAELATLGEVCAIQGQVEHLLIYTLSYILDLSTETVRKLLSASSIHTNAKIWISIVREKCSDKEVIDAAEKAFSLVEGVTKGRNDFVHAVFATPMGTSWLLHRFPGDDPHPRSKSNQAIAVRTRDISKKRPIGDLNNVRDDAARLSVLLEKIASAHLPE